LQLGSFDWLSGHHLCDFVVIVEVLIFVELFDTAYLCWSVREDVADFGELFGGEAWVDYVVEFSRGRVIGHSVTGQRVLHQALTFT